MSPLPRKKRRCMVTGAPPDYCAQSMSLDDLTGTVRKIQPNYFAYSHLTEIWMGEWSRGHSKKLVQCDSILPSSQKLTNLLRSL
jgi:hypothetical protein